MTWHYTYMPLQELLAVIIFISTNIVTNGKEKCSLISSTAEVLVLKVSWEVYKNIKTYTHSEIFFKGFIEI